MNWVFLALLSPAVYTVVNFIDKHLVSNEVKDYRAMPIYTAIVGFVAGFVFWIITGFPVLAPLDAIIVILTGILTIWAALLYFKAMSEEEATTIIILFQSLPMISLVLAFIILGETITFKQLVGFIIIFTAVVLVSLKPSVNKKLTLSSAFFLIILANFMWALAGVLIKFAINANTFSKILSYESWGIGIGGFLLFILIPSVRNSFLKNVESVKKRTLSILFINEFTFVIAKSISFLAYSLGPVALVSVLSGTQVFYGILYGYVLTKIFPKSFREDIQAKSLVRKGILALLLFLGILLVS